METVIVNIPTLNIFSVKKTTKNKLHIENILKALEDSRGVLHYGPLRFKFFSDLQENQQKKQLAIPSTFFIFPATNVLYENYLSGYLNVSEYKYGKL